ncbi:MAG: hypothetical protein K1X81_07660 [Bacteroidia bacterium]|nr:hypothetical protein [Bacteroidia bacterium]
MIEDILFERLYLSTTIMNKKGGPTECGALFDLQIEIMDTILEDYHLPKSRKYQTILFDFIDRECNLTEARKLLSQARESYLISRPALISELLQSVKEGLITSYDALTDMNYHTHTYSCFICDLLTTDQANIADVKSDLSIIEKSPELAEILFWLHDRENPQNSPAYSMIEKTGLRLYKKYLSIIEEHETISISNIQIIQIMADPKLNIHFLALHPDFNNGILFTIDLDIYTLINTCRGHHPTYYFLEKILYNESTERENNLILDFTDMGEMVNISNELRLYKQEPPDSDEFAQSYSLVGFAEEGPVYNITKIERKLKGDMPDETE